MPDPPTVRNYYDCNRCGSSWSNDWACGCDDRCPGCRTPISPTVTLDLDDPLLPAFDGTRLTIINDADRRLKSQHEDALP